jgi:hypothetical protein
MARFFTPQEAVKLRMLGNADLQQRDKGRLLTWSKYVWQDMNLTTIKRTIRQRFTINKKTRSIDMPCSFLQIGSVSVEDKYGNEYPVYKNDRVKDDIVDVSAAKDCACEFDCGHKLCNTIKGYVAVVSTKEDKNPDGSDVSFECVDRKAIDGQGFFYEQLQYPKRIYEDGVWTETIKFTEDRKLCKVEVDENGCCCDTEANIEAVCDACGIKNIDPGYCCIGGNSSAPPTESCNTWTYYCNSKLDWFMVQCGCYPYGLNGCENIYNISELGDRIIFPHNFPFDKVILRWYEDTGLNTLQIPIIAIDTFIFGLMAWDCQFNDNKQNLADKYNKIYATRKFGLIKELNKYTIAALANIVSPRIYIPGSVASRTNQYEGGYRNNYYDY